MMRRDLYYNYIGYPNVYKGGGFGNFFRGIGNWVSHPFNKTARYNASVQSNPDSYGSGEITNFNTTGNGTTDWGSMGGFATGQTSQNNITNPYQGTTMMEQSFAQTGTPNGETVDGNAFADISKSGKSEGTWTRGGGGVPWGSIISAAGTNIANALLDTEASTAERVAGVLGIPALANQWRADTSKGDAYIKDMQNSTDLNSKNYIQDASSSWGGANAVKQNLKTNITPISFNSAVPSLKDFKGNWWRNMGASVAQGAASGSVGGPWGTLGGAVTGLFGSIGGLFGRSNRADRAYKDFLAKRKTLVSAQEAAYNRAVTDQTLSNMQALANGNTQQRINDMANIRAYGGNLYPIGGTIKEGDEEVTQEPVYEGGELPEITVSAESMPWYEKVWRKFDRNVLKYPKYAYNYFFPDRNKFIVLDDNTEVNRVIDENSAFGNNYILSNEFVEKENPNTVRLAKDFQYPNQDTLLGDKNIPLSNISTYYGIENGKLKAGKASDFEDDTFIVPNRTKNVGKIKKILQFPEKAEYDWGMPWSAQRAERDKLSQEYRELYEKFVTQKKYETELRREFDKIYGQNKVTARLAGDRARRNLIQNHRKEFEEYMADWNNREKELMRTVTIKEPSPGYIINENNDTLPMPNFNAIPKMYFADENGNAAFVSGLKPNIEKVNDYLSEHPSYPIMVDNGRFKHIIEGDDINAYTGGFMNPEDNYIIGIKQKAMGGNLYTDLSPNMMSLWNNKQQIDQQKVNMQQMNFGLGNSFNQKLNTFDYGGSMNGMDLPTNMQSYENGGTHEENPYGGIQVGVDQQGNPNLVEEGEFRWGDYIFSDRINVDPTLLSRYNLAPATKHQGKKANKGKLSYADMAKKYAKKNGELANDPIGKNTLEAYMKRLQDAQEDQKFQDSMEQQKQDAINQYRKTLSTPQQGNPMYGAMKYNGMGNAATQQGVNAGMSDLSQQGDGNEVLSNTNRSGNNMLHAFGGNLFWDGGTPQIKPKLLNINPNLVLGNNYMNSWTANNAGTPRLFSSIAPMYIGENPEANFTAYQKRYPALPSDAKGMQQLLVNEGFDIGNTGQNKDGVDGIWGNKSQAAWYDFLRAYNHRPNTMNQYDLISSNNQPSTSNSQISDNGGLNLGVRDGDATTDNNNLGNGQTSYNNVEGNINIGRSNLTDGIKRDTTTTFGTAAIKEDPKQVPHYSTAGEYAMFGKGFTPMLYDWMNKTNFKYDPNQRPAYELANMGNNSTFLRTADTIGGYRAPNLMDAERMNNAAQAQGIAALQSALNVGNGNRGFAAAQTAQNAYNTQMGIGNNYATAQQINNDERFKNDSFNTALDQANANIRNSMYQDNQKAQQVGQQMKIDAKKAANDYILRNELYADATNRQAMDNRAANQATWTDNALNYFIAQAQKNDILNAKNNDITNPYWTDKNGVMHYIGDSGLNSAIYDAFTSGDSEWGNYAVNNGTFSGDRLKAWNALQEKYSAADLKAHPELWKSLVLQEKQARKEEAEKAELAKSERVANARYAFDNNMAQLNNYRTMYGDKFKNSQLYDDLMKRYNDKANATEFNDINNLDYWNRIMGDEIDYWRRYNTPVTANQSAYGGYINNNNKSNKREYYNYMRR